MAIGNSLLVGCAPFSQRARSWLLSQHAINPLPRQIALQIAGMPGIGGKIDGAS